MAEAHPVGFRWVMKAKERGATIIHVDPRHSRTSAMADLWLPIRAGSDIAFLGGLIHYAIEQNKYFKDYIVAYTNATAILKREFRAPEDDGADGLFSGWNPDKRAYEGRSWMYDSDDLGYPNRDLTMQHPRCVFQVLKRHYARYTPEMVERTCGIPRDLFFQAAEKFTAASGPERTAAFVYAVGFTHQSKGVQLIRTAAILQLLMGNMGRPGGGILALRGHASIQGSTDIPTLYDNLPGYLPMPHAGGAESTLQRYLDKHTNATGLWHDFPKYFVSLLKAYYGTRATPANQFGYHWIPKLTGDHSYFKFLYEMLDGKVEGFFVMGQNPAIGAQNGRLERKALAKTKWLVVREMVETETATFWLNSPEIDRGELRTEDIGTEVFLMPAAGHAEKEGAFTNTQRMVQWREKAVDPPGECESEGWFIHQLAKRLKKMAAASTDVRDEALRALDWWYPEDDAGEPKMEAVLAEINGWHAAPQVHAKGGVHNEDADKHLHHGPQVASFNDLKDDGSTAAGCWIYTGIYGPDGINKAWSRHPHGPYGHGWGFAWPADRRILYNRASARPDGTPWSERKKLIWWDRNEKKWVGDDVPDFSPEKAPDYQPEPGAKGLEALPGDRPFILHQDGLGWIYVPDGLEDGPLPVHYEPLESPIQNPLYRRNTNPAEDWFTREENRFSPPSDPRFPIVLTTYRLTEHHTAGGMSRWLSHLSELQPEFFVEMSPELAGELKVHNRDQIVVATMRGAIQARALVSRRIRPLKVGFQHYVHQVAAPFHWGYNGPVKGDSVNDLLAISGEPNVTIMETKALTCAIIPGLLPKGEAFVEFMRRLAPPDHPSHPEQPPKGAASGGRESIPGNSQHGES